VAESRPDTGLEKAGLLFAPRAAKTVVPNDAEDSHSDADADDPESNARFRKAARKVQAVQVVSNGILGEKLLRFDAYAQVGRRGGSSQFLSRSTVLRVNAAYVVS
jgi:hypothetical protein